MMDVMDIEESDLSFASILLGFRQSADSLDNVKNVTSVKCKNEVLNYLGSGMYDDCSATPYPGSMSSLCFQLSEAQNKRTTLSSTSPTQQALLAGIEEDCREDRDDRMELLEQNRYRLEQQNMFDQNLVELQMQKLARGRYKCSRCGALKTNHDCLMVEQLEGSSSTQIEKIILTPEEFVGLGSVDECSLSSKSLDLGMRSKATRPLDVRSIRTITVRSFMPYLSSPLGFGTPDMGAQGMKKNVSFDQKFTDLKNDFPNRKKTKNESV